MSGDYKEFSIYWIKGEKQASITLPSGSALGKKVIRLAQSRPDEVTIEPTNDDQYIMAHIPVKYIKISAPRILTDEQKSAVRDRLLNSKKLRNDN